MAPSLPPAPKPRDSPAAKAPCSSDDVLERERWRPVAVTGRHGMAAFIPDERQRAAPVHGCAPPPPPNLAA